MGVLLFVMSPTFYPILFYSILCYSILFYSILSYPILSYPILSYSILFYSILFYSILFYLFYSMNMDCHQQDVWQVSSIVNLFSFASVPCISQGGSGIGLPVNCNCTRRSLSTLMASKPLGNYVSSSNFKL